MLALTVLAAAPAAAAASYTQSGYLTAPDGSQLAYTVVRPTENGHYPVLLTVDGYSAGRAPLIQAEDNGLANDHRFALMGVNVSGTGCSSGSYDPPFRLQWAKDGAYAVSWAARQSWSTGRVGLYGTSFGGFMALYIAGERPHGLVAISPHAWTGNFRDATDQGGIYNLFLSNIFDAGVLENAAPGVETAIENGDSECAANFAEHETEQTDGGETGLLIYQHPYNDGFYTNEITEVEQYLPRIDVPVLTLNAYQDEIAFPGGPWYYNLLNPKTSWFILTNGYHGILSGEFLREQDAFLDHFVAGVNNGWQRTPKVQVWHELQAVGSDEVPRWTTGYAAWPPPLTLHSLYFGAGGVLSARRPTADEAADSYAYPRPAGSVNILGTDTTDGDTSPWSTPIPAGGNVAYTTGPLKNAVDILGASSLNLWLASTATNTDVQVTVTEIRPDGEEQYIERGWLRMSERKLAPDSTVTWPRPTDTQQDVQPLVPGQPTYARIAIYPFEHVFRAGSRIRISIEAPVGQTGDMVLDIDPTQATDTVYHDARHESAWVFTTVPTASGSVPAAYPPCGSVISEPCRTNTEGLPSAPPLTLSSSAASAPSSPGCPAATGRLSGTSLGLARLGMTRAKVRRQYARSSNRGRRYEDFFCLSPIGVRVGYPSPALLNTLPTAERKQFHGRVIWASTSNPFYAVHGVRPGATIATAAKHLELTGPFHIGLNYWYLAPNGSSTAVLKIRAGIVEEVGIADKQLTGSRKAQVVFLKSFS